MKKIVIIALLLVGTTINAQEINWLSFNEAIEAQKKEPRKIFIDAYTTWCGPCKMLDKNTFHNKDVADYVNENYYAVKFNAEGNETVNLDGQTYTNPDYDASKKGRNSQHQLSTYFNVRAYPTMIFLDEEANLIGPIPGYKTPQQLELFLKMFKTDVYKTLTNKEDWENYNANFKYEFVN